MGRTTGNGWFYIPDYGEYGPAAQVAFASALDAADELLGTMDLAPAHKHSTLWASDGSPQAVWVDVAGYVGINCPVPYAPLHSLHAGMTAPSLTNNAVAGVILGSESAQLAMGLSDTSPYPYWMQARRSGAAKDLVLQPLGGNVGINSIAPAYTLSFGGNVAKTLGKERRTGSDGNGYDFTINAGGCYAGGADRSGGALILQGGVTTGAGMSSVNIYGYPRTGTGTSDNVAALLAAFKYESPGYSGVYLYNYQDMASYVSLTFNNRNSVNGSANSAQIYATLATRTAGAEIGSMVFSTMSGGTLAARMWLKGTNLHLGVADVGSSAVKVFGIGAGTAPSSAPADMAQMWVEDVNAAAGYAGLHKRTETTNQKEVIPGVIIKTDTGDPANPYEGLMTINTYDNKVKMYADAAWRELGTW